MKHFTSKFWMARAGVGLALLLVIGLAGASAGAVTFDSTPISPTVKATEILEGTVSSVTAPASNGVGPVFSILDGEITVDASGADVLGDDGAAGTATVEVGSRIVALLAPVVGGGPDRVATNVYVLRAADTATLHGRVDAVDAAAGTFQVTGKTVHVTAATVFGGKGLASLKDLLVGDMVVVIVSATSGTTNAERVMRVGTTPTPFERIEGTVVSVGTTSWVLSVGGKETTIGVDAQTRVVGSPKTGDTVEALGRKDSAGLFVASLIVLKPKPLVHLEGKVVSEGPAAWVIAVTGASGNTTAAAVTNTTVKVDGSTKIVGSPAAGDMVEVLATKQSDASLLASLITKVVLPQTVTFEGALNGIKGMEWTVGTTKVLVTPLTVRVGSPKVGDRVKVEGVQIGSSPVMATRVTKL